MLSSFYATVSTIIPVLLLALTIQSASYLRATKKHHQVSLASIMPIIIMTVCLCITESMMLYALYNSALDSHYHMSLFWIVLVCMVMIASVALIIIDYILLVFNLEHVTIKSSKKLLILCVVIFIVVAVGGFLVGSHTAGIEDRLNSLN